jgi:hypothetical protein
MTKPLEVPQTLYGPLRVILKATGHTKAIQQDGALLDLSGITVIARGGSPETNLIVTSLLSSRTKEGMVELALNSETTQMTLDKAREVVGMLQGGIEAAVSDQMIYMFLTTKVGLSDAAASAALVDFRELRQGSRDIVRPH